MTKPKLPRTRPAKHRASGELKRERVYRVAGLMARGEWREQYAQLGQDWDVSQATLDDYAAEASRLLQWSSTEIEQLEQWCRVRLHNIASQDGRDRVPAVQTLLASIGRLKPHRADPDSTPLDADPDLVVQRAVRSILRDPQSRKILVETMQMHAPELLASELRIIETTGEQRKELTDGKE